MKKFVTTLLALLLTVALAVGFTACKDEETESYNEVTEDVWKSALSIFGGDPAKINTDDLNLTVKSKTEESTTGFSSEIVLEMDYTNKAYHGYFSQYDEHNYLWQNESNTIYRYTEDEDNKYLGTVKNSTLLEEFVEAFYEFTLAVHFIEDYEMDVVNSYADYEYDESIGGYKYEFSLTDDNLYPENFKIIFYFSGTKLAKSEIYDSFFDDFGEIHNLKYTDKYVYGPTNVTIPDEVKNYQG